MVVTGDDECYSENRHQCYLRLWISLPFSPRKIINGLFSLMSQIEVLRWIPILTLTGLITLTLRGLLTGRDCAVRILVDLSPSEDDELDKK